MNTLECSSKGDKKFSAFYAYTTVFGIYDSIEHHYQNCKRFNIQPIKIKGASPDYIEIYGIKLDKKYLTPYYKLLWVKYLDNNKDLVEYAEQFDDYNDIFKGHSINCQADVIRQYVKQGRSSIMNEELVKEFCNILRKEYLNERICKM